jgi:hypothetical protein
MRFLTRVMSLQVVAHIGVRALCNIGNRGFRRRRYFVAMVGFTQPFFITPCDGRKLR